MSKKKNKQKEEIKDTIREEENVQTETEVEDIVASEESEEKEQEEGLDENNENVLNEFDKLEGELLELKDKYLRLYSEFENYRKRTLKEKEDLRKTANESLMSDLLPVVDDFERAQKANENQQEAEPIKEGFSLIYNKMLNITTQKGLKPMKTEKGDDFDDEKHEAITQMPVEEEDLKGKIVDVVEKGYYLNDKVIRFAKVVIGS